MTQLRQSVIPLLLFLSVFCGTTNGQQYLFDHFSSKDGLGNDVINDVFQDNLGLIYISTDAGLTVYDGSTFRSLRLPFPDGSQPVIKCKPLKNGSVWVNYAANKDLIVLDKLIPRIMGLPGTWKITVNQIIDGVHPESVICSDQGLFSWKKNELQKIDAGLSDANKLIKDILPVGGKLLIAREGFKLGLLDKKSLRVIAESDTILSVNGWVQDESGNVWLATGNNGLTLIDGNGLQQGKIIRRALPTALEFLRADDIFCITRGQEGELLIGTHRYGLVSWSTSGEMKRYTTDNGLSSNKIKSILVDKDNNWWIGTNNGLDRLSNRNFRIYNRALGIEPSTIYSTETDSDQGTWFFGTKSILYLNQGISFSMSYPAHVEKIPLSTASVPNGIWVAVPAHIFHLQTKGMQSGISTVIPTRDIYRRLLVLKDGSLLAGGRSTLALLVNNQLITICDTLDEIRALHQDRFGHIWVGTFERGIYRYKMNQSGKLEMIQHIVNPNKLYPRINCFYEDASGNIWAGTRYNGILIFSNDSLNASRISTLTEENGLSNNFIYHISSSSPHTIWIANNTGFDKITLLNNKPIIEKTSAYFHFNNAVTRLMPQGNELWGSTSIGAFSFSALPEKKTTPHVLLKEIIFRDTSYQLFSSDTSLSLPHYQHSFSISFTAPYYYNEKMTRYFYRFDAKKEVAWQEVKGNNSLNFTSLRPGKYLLEIKAVTFNGQETVQIASLGINLAAPFYKTGWFVLLVSLAVGSLVYAIYRYRIKQLKKLYAIRDNISRNLHDEIGATLSSINIYSDLARKKPGTQPETATLLERIYSGSEQVMNNMNDIVWFVNPKNDSLDNIIVRMREYCIPILEARNIAIEFEASEQINMDKLNMEQRQHLYYIFKEAINNLVKYAQATRATISVAKTGKYLRLLIRDNGTGFNINKANQGNGLTNMRKRAQFMQGKLEIRSTPGIGTDIELTIPLT